MSLLFWEISAVRTFYCHSRWIKIDYAFCNRQFQVIFDLLHRLRPVERQPIMVTFQEVMNTFPWLTRLLILDGRSKHPFRSLVLQKVGFWSTWLEDFDPHLLPDIIFKSTQIIQFLLLYVLLFEYWCVYLCHVNLSPSLPLSLEQWYKHSAKKCCTMFIWHLSSTCDYCQWEIHLFLP